MTNSQKIERVACPDISWTKLTWVAMAIRRAELKYRKKKVISFIPWGYLPVSIKNKYLAMARAAIQEIEGD